MAVNKFDEYAVAINFQTYLLKKEKEEKKTKQKKT